MFQKDIIHSLDVKRIRFDHLHLHLHLHLGHLADAFIQSDLQ